MYLLTHKLPRFALLHQSQVSFRLIFCRKCVSFAAGPINTQYNFPPILHFFHLLFYCELVLRVVFRGTRRATSKIPQRTSLIMTSQNVILITFNFFFIFLGRWFDFHCKSRITKLCFSHTHMRKYCIPSNKIYEILFPLLRSKSALLLRACSTNIRI